MGRSNVKLIMCLLAASIVPAAAQVSEVVIHGFQSAPAGESPTGIIRDPEGNFYGVANFGGTANAGVIYAVDAAGHGKALYNFQGGADGANPQCVIRDSAGNLYGTTSYGYGGAADAGQIFKVSPDGGKATLYSFKGKADGGNPGCLVLDPAGYLYGVTTYGGAAGNGVLYELDTAGQETVLFDVHGVRGVRPSFATPDAAGNLYGTTSYGGASANGTVFQLDISGNETVLYSFSGLSDGENP